MIEFGDSAYSMFKMKNGEFEPTDDSVVVGIVRADSKGDAIRKAVRLTYCKGRVFDRLVVYEVKGAEEMSSGLNLQ